MAIKFSPGPCGCCNHYLVYVKFLPGSNASINWSLNTVNVGLFIPSPPAASAIVDDAALTADALLNVFAPAGQGLPLATGSQVKSIAGPPSPFVVGVNTVSIGIPVVGVPGSFEIGMYQLLGSTGSWRIASHVIKTASAPVPGPVVATFTINADHSVGP